MLKWQKIFSVEADAEQTRLLLYNLDQISPGMRRTLVREETRAEALLIDRARALASTLLQVKSGRFVASIAGEITDEPSQVMTRVFSGDPEAAILEYGGTIPAHEERPETARALMFRVGSGTVFAAKVEHPADVIKPHPTIHRAFAELLPEILSAIITGAGDAVNQEY